MADFGKAYRTMAEGVNLSAALIQLCAFFGLGSLVLNFTSLKFLVVPSVCLLVGTILASTVAFLKYKSLTSGTSSFVCGYHVVRREATLIIAENGVNQTCTRSIRLRAVRPRLSLVEFRYKWTGRGEEGLPTVESVGHRLICEPFQSDLWNYYYIHLGRELAVGEETDVRIRQHLEDTDHQFQPFYSVGLFQATDELTIAVQFPANVTPSQVHFVETKTSNETVIRTTPGTFDHENRTITWPLVKPRVGRRYLIRWVWPDAQAVDVPA